MKKILILLILTMTSCTSSNKKVIFLGDSITQAGVYDTEVGIPYDGELIYPDFTFIKRSWGKHRVSRKRN